MSKTQTKEHTRYLDDGLSIFVRLVTKSGELEDFSVVLLRNGECVARYDCAHGFPHLDRMGARKKALIAKVRCESIDLQEAFKDALDDFSNSAAKHVAYYDAH